MFKHHDLQMFRLKLSTYTRNFHPLEVVDRVSETQLQVGEFFKFNLAFKTTFIIQLIIVVWNNVFS